jgi:hypothetical protein
LRNIEEGNDILRLKEIMQNYRYDGYDINYDFFRKSKSGLKILDNLKKILKQGVLGITIPEGDTVSTRYVSIDDLASSVCNTDNTDELMAECQTGTRIAKNIVYGEYVMDSFYCYTDKGTGPALNYEVEYILNGKRSDVENLYETVKKLATIRSAVNMVYLLTDSEKKEDAYLCKDALAMEKHVSSVYDTSVFEFTSPVLRDTLAHIQKEEQNHGEKLYNYLSCNNMYC